MIPSVLLRLQCEHLRLQSIGSIYDSMDEPLWLQDDPLRPYMSKQDPKVILFDLKLFSATPGWSSMIPGRSSATPRWESPVKRWASTTPGWALPTPEWCSTTTGWFSTNRGSAYATLRRYTWLQDMPARLKNERIVINNGIVGLCTGPNCFGQLDYKNIK